MQTEQNTRVWNDTDYRTTRGLGTWNTLKVLLWNQIYVKRTFLATKLKQILYGPLISATNISTRVPSSTNNKILSQIYHWLNE